MLLTINNTRRRICGSRSIQSAVCIQLLILGLLLRWSAWAADSQNFPKAGEWPCFRRNPNLDAYSPVRGNINQPGIVWRQFIGKLETKLLIEPGATNEELQMPAAVSENSDAHTAMANFFTTGLKEEDDNSSPNVVYADVLTEELGKEKIEFESGFSKPTLNGQWQECVGRCFARRQGKWVLAWETQKIPYLFQALPLVGDFDGDKQPEIAILPFYELLILDGRTGRLKDRCRFTDTRSYGFFGVYDFDGDGRSEFLVQADFSKHVDVLGFRQGKLSLLWQKLIETDISNPQKILRVGPNPVGDVDGDGKLEVLINTHNHTDDGRWHLYICEAMTGKIQQDIPDECLVALLDVNSDSRSELLTYRATSVGIPEFGGIYLRSFKDCKLVTLWEQTNAAWATWEQPLPSHVKSTATFGRQTVLSQTQDKQVNVVVRRKPVPISPRIELSLMHWDKESFCPITTITGQQLIALGFNSHGRLLISCQHDGSDTPKDAIEHGRVVGHFTRQLNLSPGTVAVAWPDQSKKPVMIAQGLGDELVIFQSPGLEKSDVVRIHGRGQSTSWPEARGPVIADLKGDGRRQILMATSAPSGCARMVACDLGGSELWHHDFNRIPGNQPVWNTGGLILWQVGHFTDVRRQDVLVTVRRSMMHSEETSLLSGMDGHELWRRDRQISQRGVGGTPFAIADFDRDGLDDAASFHPSIFYLLQGTTGQDIVAKDASWPSVPAKPVYWGLPIAGRFLNDTQNTLFFGGRSMTGLIRTDGSLVWWDALDNSPSDWPAFGHFTGNRNKEMMGWGYQDGIRCYDISNGKVVWRMPSPLIGVPTGCASADLDGDGKEEAVFVIDKTLVCIGSADNGKSGEVRWKLQLPAPAGPPSIAALDQSGGLAIIINSMDGYVYCIQ